METNEKKEFINDNIIYKKTLSISGIIYLAVAIAIFSEIRLYKVTILH